MYRIVDYGTISEVYDRRYERSDYSPVVRLLLGFARGGNRLPEIGCGTGQWLCELAKAGYDAVGLDPSQKMLTSAMQKSRQSVLIQGRAESIPFRTGTVDRLYCINAFHHFCEQERSMIDARRVLRNGGGILIIGILRAEHIIRDQYHLAPLIALPLLPHRCRVQQEHS